MADLRGTAALVTGASRGIGRACAIKRAALGAAVVVNYNKSDKAADDVVAEIERGGGAAVAVQGDVSRFAAAQGVVKAALEAYGPLDILVNNAGTTRDRLLASMTEEDFDVIIEQHLKSVIQLPQGRSCVQPTAPLVVRIGRRETCQAWHHSPGRSSMTLRVAGIPAGQDPDPLAVAR